MKKFSCWLREVSGEDASEFPPTPEDWGELLGNRNTRMSVKVHVDPRKGSPTGELTLIDRETGQRETVRTSAAGAERLLRRFGHK